MYKHARTAGWGKKHTARQPQATPIGQQQRDAEKKHAEEIRKLNAKKRGKKSGRKREKPHWSYDQAAADRINRPRAPDVQWPIYVTSGTNPDGTLRTHVLKSRAHADQLGFTWAGQPSGSSAR